jgi:hypothetical protein
MIPVMDQLPTGKPKTARARSAAKRKLPKAQTQFAYPKRRGPFDLSFSRKERKLTRAMREYAQDRLMPKLRARTIQSPGCNRHDDLDVRFADACVYLRSWLGYGNSCGIVEFPFARLYPVAGGRYNLAVRRLCDWSRAEDTPLVAAINLFWNLAPNANHWIKIARHRTFEECIDLLVQEPAF